MLGTMRQESEPRTACAWNTPSVSWGGPGRRKSRHDSDTCRCARPPPRQGIKYIFLAPKGPRKYTLYGKITCLNFRSKKFLGRKTTSTGTPAAENGCIRRSSARRAQPWPPEPPTWTETGLKIAIYFFDHPSSGLPPPQFWGSGAIPRIRDPHLHQPNPLGQVARANHPPPMCCLYGIS